MGDAHGRGLGRRRGTVLSAGPPHGMQNLSGVVGRVEVSSPPPPGGPWAAAVNGDRRGV